MQADSLRYVVCKPIRAGITFPWRSGL